MLTKQLGQTGVLLPVVGIGTWGYRAGPAVLRSAIEAGCGFIDTAESYGTEEVVGEAICGLRDRVFVATKVSSLRFRPRDFRAAAEASLRRLRIDVIDLLQLHQPNSQIPIAETMEAMAELIDEGKVRFAGVSNFSVEQLREAQSALGKHPIVSNQLRYNIVDRTIEGRLMEYCQRNRITVIAYSPLARDFRRISDCDPAGLLESLRRETGCSEAQIAINWCISKEGVVAIPKGNSLEHILDCLAASTWRLTPEQLGLLDSVIRHHRRGRVDALVRRIVPASMRTFALRAAGLLPPSLRRRVL